MATVDELLERARSRLDRLGPHEAARAMDEGAWLVDIRSDSHRARDGEVPGARFIPRNVLEWRVAELAECDTQVILMCHEGFQSSLAAATLQELGLERATDLIGGFAAWRDAGLPVEPGGD